MNVLSRARRWVLWTLCGIAVLAGLFVLVLPWSTRLLVNRIALVLSDEYGIDFTAGRVEFALRSLSFTLHDVRLTTEAVPQTATVVATRVNLDLATAALRGDLAFDRIEVVDPIVSWIAGDRGAGAPETRSRRAASPTEIVVSRLDVRNLDATVSTTSSRRITVQGLSATLQRDVQGALAGEVRVDRAIRVETEDIAGTIDRVIAAVSIGNQALAVRSLAAESGASELRLDGAVTFGERGGYDLKYRTAIEVSELQKWSGRSPPGRGRAELSGSIAGELADPRFTFDLKARDSDVGGVSATSIEATGHGSGEAIVVDRSELHSAEGVFKARGRVALGASDRSTLAGEWRLPSLRALASTFNVSASTMPALQVLGTTTLTWSGPIPELGSVSGDVHADLNNPGVASLAATGSLGNWKLQYRHKLAGETVAELQLAAVLDPVEIRRSRLDGVVDVSSADVAALWRQLGGSVAPNRALADSFRSGHLTARGSVAGSIGEPVVDLHFTGDEFSVGDLNDIRVTGTVHADRRQIVLKPLTVDTAGAHLEMRGSVDVAQLDSTGEFDAQIDDPGRLAFLLPDDWRPTGSIAAKGTLAGRLDRPRVSARLTGADLMANGLHFARLTGDVDIAGNELVVRDLRLSQSGGELRVDGRYDLRERLVSASVEGHGLHVSLLRIVSRDDADRAGADVDLENVTIGMRVDGPLPRPTGEMSLTAERLRLNGRDAGAVTARARTADEQILVDVEAPRFGAVATGTVGVDSPRPWTTDVKLNGTDILPALAVLGVDPDTLSDTTASLSASGHASGDLDSGAVSRATLEVHALQGQTRGQPLSLVQPARVTLDGGALALDPLHVRLGELSVRAAGSWPSTRDVVTEGIVVNLQGRVADVLRYLPPASRERLSGEGPLRVDLTVRRDGSVAVIGGDVFAQATVVRQKVPQRIGRRPLGAQGLSGEVRLALDLRASAFDLGAIDGTIVASTLAISAGQFAIAQQSPATMRIEQGRLHIDRFDVKLPVGQLAASGTIGLLSPHQADLRVRGASALGLLDVLLPGVAGGRAVFDLQMTGPMASPQYEATIELTDASVLLPEGRASFAGWTGRLEVTGETVTATGLTGQINGGDVTLDGTVTRRGAEPSSPLTITARNVFLEIVDGLRSELNADLSWRNPSGRAALSGTATITADPYTEPATAMARMVAALTRASTEQRDALPPHWLGDTTLDVKLQSSGPLTIENSIGNVELVPDLHLTGTISAPGLGGSIAVVDDGRIRVGGRSYRLRESSIVFTPEQGLVPRLNVSGETRIGDYDVTLRLSGSADAIETSLSSNPPLSDRDLQSLVVTGQTAGLTGETANSDAFAVGAASGDVLGVAGQFVGLDSVRVGSSDDLELVSSDVEPSTRLTVSKRLGQRFELVLSENLDDSELTWVIIYRPRPGYEVRLSSSESEENTLEFRQEVTFGPGSSFRPTVVRAERAPDLVTAITVSGEPGFSPAEVTQVLELREGERFDFRQWTQDRDRLRRFYHERGYYAAHITPTRKLGDATSKRREVALDYRVLRGPLTELEIAGYPSSVRLLETLKDAWSDALLSELLAQDLELATRAHLVDEGYLRPQVEATLDSSRPGVLRAVVAVEPGVRSAVRQLAFQGNQAISTGALQTLVTARGLATSVWNDPAPLIDEIDAEYAANGYLAATVAVGDVLLEGDRATLPVLISEGPLARVETLEVAGVAPERQEAAHAALGLAVGSPFAAGAERAARIRLERYYRDRGYRDARVAAATRVAARDGRVDLRFTVTEGPLYVVRAVRVEGAESTRDSLVDRAVTIAAGDAAGQSQAAETERRLYGIGTFRAAAVRFEPVPFTSSQQTVPVDAVVEVQEARRYLLRYGITLSNEYDAVLDEELNSVGVAADLRDRNFLGRGIALGVGARVERNLSSVRGLLSMPTFASLPLRTNVSLTVRSETQKSETDTLYTDDEANFTLEQRWRPRGWLELAWGYSASGRAVSFQLPEPVNRPTSFDGLFASLNTTAVLDRRDSVFDPTRGWFYSTSLQWGLRALGSDFGYLRTLLRGSFYQPIGPLVLATSARWGHLQSLGGTPPLTVFDLFFKAGGTQTVRGYKQDELSAYEAFDIPIGGPRLAVFNQEVRFPLYRIVKGVLFADAGNTFAARTGFSFADLKAGVGFGFRINTPLAPVRIDIGYPVPRREGATSPRWHFSIGQMF